MRKELNHLWLSDSDQMHFGQIVVSMGLEPDDPLDVVREKCEATLVDFELSFKDHDVDRLSELLYAHSDVIVDSSADQIEGLFEGHEIELAFQDLFADAGPGYLTEPYLDTNRESARKIHDILG